MATFLAASRTVSSGSSRFAAWSIEKPVVKGSEGQVVTDVAPGDVMITTIAHDRKTDLLEIPAGWTLLRTTRPPAETNGNNKALATYYKLATASEPGSYTWGSGDGTTVGYVAGSVSFRGVDTANPFGAHDGIGFRDAVSGPVVAPSVNVSGSDAILYTIHSIFGGFVSNSPPPEMTGRWFVSDSPATGLGSTEPRSAGATGTRTAGFSSSLRAAQSIVVRNANRAPTAPGTPTVTPNPVNTTGTISWPASSDPDGDAVTYDVDLSTDGGTTFPTNIRSAQAGTSFVYDFTNVAATTTARVRVRARDTSNALSGYTQSANFTINRAPNAPTLLAPVGGSVIDRTITQRFSHQFSDPNPGDSQSAYDIGYRLVGATSFTTAFGSSPNQFHDFAAGTFPAGDYEWRVRTYDQPGLVGPYSASGFFTATTPPPGPTITAPVNNATISQNTADLVWSYPTQQAYQVRILDENDAVVYDSGVVESASTRSVTLSFPVNNVTRKSQVRVRDAGLWSPYTTVTNPVSYTPPATPSVALTVAVDFEGQPFGLVVAVTNPAPSGGQPTVTQHDVYVRTTATSPAADRYRPFSDDGLPVKRGVVPGGTWTDAATASGVKYEYAAVSLGANGTSSTSAWVSALPGPDPEPSAGYPSAYASTY